MKYEGWEIVLCILVGWVCGFIGGVAFVLAWTF